MDIGNQKWPKPSPTSYSCHYHILSPTSVSNIYVSVEKYWFEHQGVGKFSWEVTYQIRAKKSNLRSELSSFQNVLTIFRIFQPERKLLKAEHFSIFQKKNTMRLDVMDTLRS